MQLIYYCFDVQASKGN